MLIYAMSVSVDGFIADREGGFAWSVPSDEQFRFHLARPLQSSNQAPDTYPGLRVLRVIDPAVTGNVCKAGVLGRSRQRRALSPRGTERGTRLAMRSATA